MLLGREPSAGPAARAAARTPATGPPRALEAPRTTRVAAAGESIPTEEVERAGEAPLAAEVAPAAVAVAAAAAARGLTRVAVPPSSVETRRISDGLPDAVMLGLREGLVAAEERWVAKLLVIASRSRAVALLDGLAGLKRPVPRVCSGPSGDEVSSTEKSLVTGFMPWSDRVLSMASLALASLRRRREAVEVR